MTRAYRRPIDRRADLSSLTSEQRRHLETGSCYFAGFRSLDEMRLAWETHREALLAEWVSARPGTRPFAEWLFELIPKHGERRTTKHWTREHEENRAEWLTLGILHADTLPPICEFQHEYLDRHGLLSADERKSLGKLPRADRWNGWHNKERVSL